jgi:hypothetical protein
MKIVEQSPTLLKIEWKGYFWMYSLGCLFIRLIFASLPLYWGLIFLRDSQSINLRCNRMEPTQVNCQLTSSRFLGETSIPIHGLKGAEVKETETDDGSDYQILLITKGKHIPLGNSLSFSESHKIVAQIHTFIGDRNRFILDIQQDNRFWFTLYGLIFIGIGSGVIYSALLFPIPYSFIFDKVSGLMYMKSKSFFKTEYRELRLSDIQEVRVVEEIQESEGSKTKIYTINRTRLALRSGKEIYLIIFGDVFKHYEVARTINDFLNINSLPDV